ncbi:hypothetical protein CLV51_10397 [Chitinophaga niastensis]|uniref:Lipoprotein n=1 Tax=Chitinophaga niastensis TaxID=536980 RepID=A0A2P8HIS0_CHINA|nr:hypothetical protein [Chitinophaga niastensis]PSL46121.1 hypothetical protein CLV51_10397 [Chitinophaga niastensis]
MKKVAIVLCLSTLALLFVACRGKMVDCGHPSASNPDIMPFYLITLGNFHSEPACPPAKASVVPEKAQLPAEWVKDALILIIQHSKKINN